MLTLKLYFSKITSTKFGPPLRPSNILTSSLVLSPHIKQVLDLDIFAAFSLISNFVGASNTE